MARSPAPAIVAPLGPVVTERLELRRFEAADLDGLAAVFSRPEVWAFPYGRAFTREETADFLDAQIEAWDEYGFGCWIARLRQTPEPIGYVGLSVPTFLPEILPAVEVGWRFHPDHWGRGLATEGARAALREGFTTLGLSEICSCPSPPTRRRRGSANGSACRFGGPCSVHPPIGGVRSRRGCTSWPSPSGATGPPPPAERPGRPSSGWTERCAPKPWDAPTGTS